MDARLAPLPAGGPDVRATVAVVAFLALVPLAVLARIVARCGRRGSRRPRRASSPGGDRGRDRGAGGRRRRIARRPPRRRARTSSRGRTRRGGPAPSTASTAPRRREGSPTRSASCAASTRCELRAETLVTTRDATYVDPDPPAGRRLPDRRRRELARRSRAGRRLRDQSTGRAVRRDERDEPVPHSGRDRPGVPRAVRLLRGRSDHRQPVGGRGPLRGVRAQDSRRRHPVRRLQRGIPAVRTAGIRRSGARDVDRAGLPVRLQADDDGSRSCRSPGDGLLAGSTGGRQNGDTHRIGNDRSRAAPARARLSEPVRPLADGTRCARGRRIPLAPRRGRLRVPRGLVRGQDLRALDAAYRGGEDPR